MTIKTSEKHNRVHNIWINYIRDFNPEVLSQEINVFINDGKTCNFSTIQARFKEIVFWGQTDTSGITHQR